VLLALALLILVSTVLLTATAGLFRDRSDRPEEAFWNAINHARELALETDRPVTLRSDRESEHLFWSDGDRLDGVDLPGTALRFLPMERASARLIGGVRFEGDALARVRVYPDGTCDPFRIELTATGQAPRILQIDPWTCAPVLRAASP
jgi:general secretion pathway protein H